MNFMWIEREISHALQKLAQKRPAILVTGCRQSGKTSLLKKEFPDISYITLDVPLHAQEAAKAGDFFLQKYGTPLIIDEIQYAPELLRYIKVHIDAQRTVNGQFFLTGSQKFSLMEGVSESLAGRIGIMNLYTLSLKELKSLKEKMNRNTLLNHMFLGGYPEIHAANLHPFEFFNDYIATYIERDVRQIVNVKNIRDFDRFLRLLAVRSGQLLSLNSLASDVGVSGHTLKSWLTTLEISNIIHLLPPYYKNLGKRLVKTPKLYFLDTGLLLYLLGIHSVDELLASPLLGSVFETLCFGQIIRYYANKAMQPNVYFFRDAYGHEVDFVIPRGGKLILIEAKWFFDPDNKREIFNEIEKLIPPHKIEKKIVMCSQNEEAALGNKLSVGSCDDPGKFLA